MKQYLSKVIEIQLAVTAQTSSWYHQKTEHFRLKPYHFEHKGQLLEALVANNGFLIKIAFICCIFVYLINAMSLLA
jgi:Golgi nucleoside diphosphatase